MHLCPTTSLTIHIWAPDAVPKSTVGFGDKPPKLPIHLGKHVNFSYSRILIFSWSNSILQKWGPNMFVDNHRIPKWWASELPSATKGSKCFMSDVLGCSMRVWQYLQIAIIVSKASRLVILRCMLLRTKRISILADLSHEIKQSQIAKHIFYNQNAFRINTKQVSHWMSKPIVH